MSGITTETDSDVALLDQTVLAVGLILGLINGFLLICMAIGKIPYVGSTDVVPISSSPVKSKSFGVYTNHNFDINSFLRHLRKGTFEVRKVSEDGTLSHVFSLLLTVDNSVVLESKISPKSTVEETNSAPIFKLFNLKGAQVMEQDDVVRIMVAFDDQTMALSCEAEDDIMFIAQGFLQLAIKLKEDRKFVEELLCDAPLLDTPEKNTSLGMITSVATTILSVPVMPLYGILKALESDTNVSAMAGNSPAH